MMAQHASPSSLRVLALSSGAALWIEALTFPRLCLHSETKSFLLYHLCFGALWPDPHGYSSSLRICARSVFPGLDVRVQATLMLVFQTCEHVELNTFSTACCISYTCRKKSGARPHFLSGADKTMPLGSRKLDSRIVLDAWSVTRTTSEQETPPFASGRFDTSSPITSSFSFFFILVRS
jgi:hypothetical protein